MRNNDYYSTVRFGYQSEVSSKEKLRLRIQAQTQEFLDAGGSITKVDAGSTGTKDGIPYLTIDKNNYSIQRKDLKNIV